MLSDHVMNSQHDLCAIQDRKIRIYRWKEKDIVPEHAEVANAIGAVTGKVTLRATVSIQPDAGGGFLMLSPIGRGEFADLREAQEAATERIVAHLRQAAGRFGTDEQAVTVDVVQRTGRLLDGSDQLIEVRVEGLLEGRPRTALAAGD